MKIHPTLITFVMLALFINPLYAQGARGALVRKVFKWALGGAAVAGAGYAVFSKKNIEEQLQSRIQRDLNNHKDEYFKEIHPVGKAKSIKVHGVESQWTKNPPTDMSELRSYVVRYTIFWEGPITKDGYTKMAALYDAEVGRYVAAEVLATNGTTNQDVGEIATNFLTGLLHGWASSE